MGNRNNVNGKTGTFINWITVWGFIFGCIAFNLYIDNRQTVLKKNHYRTRYEAASQRADSLYRETIRLERHLQKIEASTVQRTSADVSGKTQKSLASSEL